MSEFGILNQCRLVNFTAKLSQVLAFIGAIQTVAF